MNLLTTKKIKLVSEKISKLKQLSTIKQLIQTNPTPSLNDLDKKLKKYLDYKNGFFVELGANDGYNQSNTFYLEYCKNWTGILIEGIPELYEKCKYNRINSIVENYACVSNKYQDKMIMMKYANLMSVVDGAFSSRNKENEHVLKGIACQNINNYYTINVPATTLTSILTKHHVKSIDLLSLDVEGYELNVLKGLDFDQFQPKYICVEVRNFYEINSFLTPRYKMIEQISNLDYLYKLE